MSFGRKGMAQGALAASGPVNLDDTSSAVAAFIASERALAPGHRQPGQAIRQAPTPETRQAQIASWDQHSTGSAPARKSMGLAYVLWWFLYAFSAHRFYLGETKTAIQQCASFLGGLAVLMIGLALGDGFLTMAVIGGLAFLASSGWMLLDVFLIPGMCRRANAWTEDMGHVFD